MAILKEGARAPDFAMKSTTGETIRLSDYKNKRAVVLYFYPKDMTPGCTKEACDFSGLSKKFDGIGAEIFGVSSDSVESHGKFTKKYKLSFPLLVDENRDVSKKYGVYQKKSLYGRSFMGIVRTTFVIDKDQVIRKIFPKVKVEGHAEAVLEAVKSL